MSSNPPFKRRMACTPKKGKVPSELMIFVRADRMAEKPIPVEEVRTMVSHGFSERDIIRQLKSQGYSFGDIEKAIMEVVKSGVTAEGSEPAPQAAPQMEDEESSRRPQHPPSRRAYEAPEALEPLPPVGVGVPEMPPPEKEAPQEEEEQQYVEDIVESVLEEKFEKFTSEMNILKEEFEQLRSSVAMLKQKKPESTDLSPDITKRLDDLEARIGGLEKAFRQYLPELAKGVERLSKIIKSR